MSSVNYCMGRITCLRVRKGEAGDAGVSQFDGLFAYARYFELVVAGHTGHVVVAAIHPSSSASFIRKEHELSLVRSAEAVVCLWFDCVVSGSLGFVRIHHLQTSPYVDEDCSRRTACVSEVLRMSQGNWPLAVQYYSPRVFIPHLLRRGCGVISASSTPTTPVRVRRNRSPPKPHSGVTRSNE